MPNYEKFVKKKYKRTAKRLLIMVQGHDDLEGTYFEIVAFTSDVNSVADIAELLFNAALRCKPEFVNV